jgi:sporulation protein YlmC with PRC-barrel domain
MRITHRKNCFVALATTTFSAWMLAPLAFPQEQKKERIQSGSNVAQLDPVTSGANIRASKLIGMSIRNTKGESVGQINDIVLDARTGKVRYAAVTYGGLFGLGNKMFAVPFEAFKVGSVPNQGNNFHLVLDVTPKQLEGSVGFDEEHWPDFADKKFLMDLDQRYKIDRRIQVDVDRSGVDVKVTPPRP